MPLDLLAPILRQPQKPIFGTILAGDAVTGRITPRDYRAMIAADNDWVYRCARVNAENVAKVHLRLYRRSTDEEVQEHPFLVLLRDVNPGMNHFDLFELTELYLELIGNAYWYLAPRRLINPLSGRNVPGEVWPLMAQYVKVVPGRSRLVEGYLYQLPGGPIVAFTPEELIHFKFPSAESLYYGKGPVEGGRRAVDSHEQMVRYEQALFRNMARPDGALITEKDLTREQITQLRAEWARIHQGADRTGNVAILHRGLKYEQIATTPKELDYLKGKEFNREQVCSMFGVPLSKLGIEVAADRAAAEAHDLTYQKETIQPRLIRLQEKLNEELLPIYDPDLEARFDDPVPSNNEFALKKRDSDLDRGVVTINEIREAEGEEPVPWGDEPFIKTPTFNFGGGNGATPAESAKMLVRSHRTAGRWEKFLAATWPTEKHARRLLRQFFVEQRRIVEANVERLKGYRLKATEPLADRILFPLVSETQRLAIVAKPLVEQALAAGVAFGAEGLADIDFDLLNPLTIQALEERVAFFSKRVNDETARALTDQIRQGVEQGETTAQIADRVQEVYDQAVGFRSIRIARTEINMAANRGALLSYKAGGATTKQWITARDEFVREQHQAMEGRSVGVNQKFILPDGTQLDHPADPDGPPAQVINCRCVSIGVVERES